MFGVPHTLFAIPARAAAKPLALLSLLALLGACSKAPESTSPTTQGAGGVTAGHGVSDERLVKAGSEPDVWLGHGRTYDEQRYSPLKQIDAANVGRLGLAWSYRLPTRRGTEATPLVVDGVLYTTGPWSIVYAMNAASGELLWTYDPKVPTEWARYACCDVVNRGVAAWGDKIFVATLDGRLVALDASTGEMRWSTQTTDPERPYTITGAPRVVKGKVIIGNGGAELGVRGYVSAYDADSGQQAWRFYTVPGDPSLPFESEVLQGAADTWKGGEWWKIGGGGTVWDSMAYDPELDLLYVGVGNGSPWSRHIRSPGGGDNLFLSSIVALKPDTGAYVWHYQTTPGDSWDYTATQHMILTDLEIGGQLRKVIMQAPKNGFFYVLDRQTGELISASNFVQTTWASHIDMETGRPVETPGARFADAPSFALPSPFGGHNWHPMSYSPDTGLVYIPAQEFPFVYGKDETFKYAPGYWNLGVDGSLSATPEDPEVAKQLAAMIKGRIIAWNPVTQKEAFHVDHPGPWNGGLLTTGGNLLFQGTPGGQFSAYRADNGERLWEFSAQTGIVAAPITYRVDGVQYVAVMAGWGGTFPLFFGSAYPPSNEPVNELLVFKLDGDAILAPPVRLEQVLPEPPEQKVDAEILARGKKDYHLRCAMCHGESAVGGGILPDLRYMNSQTHQDFYAIVLGGARSKSGMPPFGQILSAEEVDGIHAYIIDRAQNAWAQQATVGE
ncbi:MAG: PQQ-dependent dehydrogenase, methanol/ethanol family [Gammaproteobacteria bacterium]|jgi:PQQ-dependent dehydrogenase (methanol/ethanol family)|nr:PQQ-dependent dehydrogenase, methanol/ethanol family [Gammaproteobacteria bacterium]